MGAAVAEREERQAPDASAARQARERRLAANLEAFRADAPLSQGELTELVMERNAEMVAILKEQPHRTTFVSTDYHTGALVTPDGEVLPGMVAVVNWPPPKRGDTYYSAEVVRLARISKRRLLELVERGVLSPAFSGRPDDPRPLEWKRHDVIEACLAARLREWRVPFERIADLLTRMRELRIFGQNYYRGEKWAVIYSPTLPEAESILVSKKDALAEAISQDASGAVVIPIHLLLEEIGASEGRIERKTHSEKKTLDKGESGVN